MSLRAKQRASVLPAVYIQVPYVVSHTTATLTSLVDFDAKPHSFAWVVLLELETTVEFPQGLIGRDALCSLVHRLEVRCQGIDDWLKFCTVYRYPHDYRCC